jgi:hypothetical protein
LILNYSDGTQSTVEMDATWKTANSLRTGWNLISFNANSWSNALVLGSYGIRPWGTGVAVTGGAPLPIFRRPLTVNSGLQRALIYICGLGQYELSANGVKVGGALLAPAWSMYNKTCLYDTLDLTSYVTNGDNALGVMLGNGMYNVESTTNYSKFTGSFGSPTLIAQLYLFYTNCTVQVIPTDTNWQTASGPITYSHVYGGEVYDARLWPAGWNAAGFDASAWSPAVLTNGPGGTLLGQSHAAPPIVTTQTRQPGPPNNLANNFLVYDLGQNATIIPNLTMHGPAGAVVQITPAELTNADGSVNRASVGGGTAFWQYTLAGTGSETWMPRFFYHGCRYLQVALMPAAGSSQLPSVDALQAVVIQSASTNAGTFSCSFDLFNRIRTATRWAQANNLFSILTDCPHRERLGWLEEANLNGPSLRYEFDLGLLVAKQMQDMADSQTSDGLVPDISPEFTVFSGGFRDSPEWGSSVILLPWQQYLFTGDDTLMRQYYPAMTNYFQYLAAQAAGNFLNYPNGLGDWYDIGPNAPGYPQNTPVSLTADAYYCLDAQILGQVAAEIGRTNDAAVFNLLATNIAAAFNNTYYSAANGYYSTGSQTAQAFPLYLGIVSPANQASVMAALIGNINSAGLTTGEVGHRYLLRALTDFGRPDVVFNLHSGTSDPGYGYILNQGATALTEAWDGNPADSQDHFMLGHITEWFYHDLAGIQPDPAAPGFQHLLIKPAFVGGISWADASYNSARGAITSAWTLTNNLATLNVAVPVGSTGTICLPMVGVDVTNVVVTESGAVIWQNGAALNGAAGVTFNQMQSAAGQTNLNWTVGSGTYQFAWNVLPPPKTYTWSAPVPIATADATLNMAGAIVGAACFGATTSSITVTLSNGTNILFKGDGSTATCTGQAEFTGANTNRTGNESFDTVLNSAEYNNGPHTITLKGLTPGQYYSVQLFALDDRNPTTVGFRQFNYQDPNDATDISATSTMNANVYIVGTFVATNANMVIRQNLPSSNNGNLNALIIRTLPPPPSTIPPPLNWLVTGNQIQFGWPVDHLGWCLQVQSNSDNSGIGTNWVTVSGSNLTNGYTCPMGTNNGAVFYRLVYARSRETVLSVLSR